MSLIPWVHYNYGHATGKAVEDFFNGMGMPYPEKHEYTISHSNGCMLFLDDYGLIIRFTHKVRCPLIKHPDLLQPVIPLDAELLRIGIYPGQRSPDPWISLSEKFKSSGIIIVDDFKKNYRRSPALSLEEPRGRLVYIDVEDGIKVDQEKYDNASNNANNQENDWQDLLYKPLRDLFLEAWPSGKKSPDLNKMARFWNECKKFKAAEKLVSSWTDETGDMLHAYNLLGGKKYAKRWQGPGTYDPARNPVFNIEEEQRKRAAAWARTMDF